MKIFIILLFVFFSLVTQALTAAVLGLQEQGAAQEAAIMQAIQEGRIQGPMAPGTGPGGFEPPEGIAFPRVDDSEIQQVADISEVLDSLEHSSRIWPLIADAEIKIFIVREYIQMFSEHGIIIRHPPEHYVVAIDAMAQESQAMLDIPFMQVMQIVAIIEYDFDNGQDKDAMARQILGNDQAWQANRQRLGF